MASPSAQFSLTLRVELPSRPGGVLAKVTAAITRAGGAIVAVDTVQAKGDGTLREITVECSSVEHRGQVITAVQSIRTAKIVEITDRTFEVHRRGKIHRGINLEDISSPRCFEIEQRLQEALDIPVFHDDQHGTAIVTLAALINACRLTGRRMEDLEVLMVGAGAAGVAVAKILMDAGVTAIVACDRFGAIHRDRRDYEAGSMNAPKSWLAEHTNLHQRDGTPQETIEGTDLFIGLSGPGIIGAADLQRMNAHPFVFAMANPNPEVPPEEAAPHVRVMATGRSDYPNQINNVLAFPGVFRGALDARATGINEEMKLAAAE